MLSDGGVYGVWMNVEIVRARDDAGLVRCCGVVMMLFWLWKSVSRGE
jgi:hypothetical protein